jgi:thioredoxin
MMKMDQKMFEEQVFGGSKPVLVEFWAPWCVYCRRIAPALEKLSQQQENLIIGQVNIDEEPLLANREHIEVIPTFVLYENGQALGSIVAPESKARIEEFIRETLGY